MHKRNKVSCPCSKCKGKLRDPRIRNDYMNQEKQMEARYRSDSSKLINVNKSVSRDDHDDEKTLKQSKSSDTNSSSESSNSSGSSEELDSEQRLIFPIKQSRNKKFKVLGDQDDEHLDLMLSDEEFVLNDDQNEAPENPDDDDDETSENSDDDDEDFFQDQFTAPGWDGF